MIQKEFKPALTGGQNGCLKMRSFAVALQINIYKAIILVFEADVVPV
jgi:hypothetical protein